MENYDVVIIGAGPAGGFLAYKLKDHGIKVLLLEKKKFPRYKTCAGGLSKKAYDFLYSENKHIKDIVEKTTNKGLYVRDNKFTLVHPQKDLIYMTYRSDLDNFLVKSAVDNKTVFFKDGIKIQKINKKENTITFLENKKVKKVIYKVLVGAWGNNIRYNKIIDLYPFKRFDLSSSWEGPAGPKFSKYSDEYVLTQIMKKYPGYVCYIFPKSELITAGIFTSIYPFPKVWKDVWNDFVEFWGLDKKIKPNYAVIPIRDHNKPIARDNILLVGDAAGIVDPFVGEGLHWAFLNGKIVANVIINFFRKDDYDLASEYHKNIDSEVTPILKCAKFYVFMFNLFPNFSFWFGSETSIGRDIIIKLITGEIKYNEVHKILNCFKKRFLG
jgi:geranylgeranyl reductase family protein